MPETEITKQLIHEIERQIETYDKDDPMRLLLILEIANFRELKRMKGNPMIGFGEMFRGMGRGFTLLLFVIAWILLIVIPNMLYRLLATMLGISLPGIN
jgi:hypothetical protein